MRTEEGDASCEPQQGESWGGGGRDSSLSSKHGVCCISAPLVPGRLERGITLETGVHHTFQSANPLKFGHLSSQLQDEAEMSSFFQQETSFLSDIGQQVMVEPGLEPRSPALPFGLLPDEGVSNPQGAHLEPRPCPLSPESQPEPWPLTPAQSTHCFLSSISPWSQSALVSGQVACPNTG